MRSFSALAFWRAWETYCRRRVVIRIAERERVVREAIAREAAERAAAEAVEAAAEAARKAEEEAREARRVEQARLDAAAAAEREDALLAIGRAGRKKKRKGN